MISMKNAGDKLKEMFYNLKKLSNIYSFCHMLDSSTGEGSGGSDRESLGSHVGQPGRIMIHKNYSTATWMSSFLILYRRAWGERLRNLPAFEMLYPARLSAFSM